MSKVFHFIALACTLTLVTASAVAAENLIRNPTFDTDVSGWDTDFASTVEWSPLDANNSAQSGSALVRNPAASGAYGITQCIRILPGGTYDFSVSTYVPAGQAGFSMVQLRLWLLPEPDCTGDTLEYFQHVASSGQWIVAEEPDILVPQGAHSALMRFMIFKTEASEVIAHFDEVYFVPEPSSTLLFAAALLALATLTATPRLRHG